MASEQSDKNSKLLQKETNVHYVNLVVINQANISKKVGMVVKLKVNTRTLMHVTTVTQCMHTIEKVAQLTVNNVRTVCVMDIMLLCVVNQSLLTKLIINQTVAEQNTATRSMNSILSVQDGIIFRGERAVIPAELRKVLKEKIHSSHLGIEGCLRRACEAIYWPNMNSDMNDYISKCSVCRSTIDCQQRKP